MINLKANFSSVAENQNDCWALFPSNKTITTFINDDEPKGLQDPEALQFNAKTSRIAS